jgi:type IV pilus assembly protein PilW
MIFRLIANKKGFTLIELLIAMAISGVVLAGIYKVYASQMQINNTQNQVVEMQQNARVAMHFLEKEIRMAGLDPTGTADAGVTAAASNAITFSVDITGGEADGRDNDNDGTIDNGEWFDGDPEQITYALSNDTNSNGINDALEGINTNRCDLLRNGQPLASNVDALNFVYLGIDDSDGTCGENCPLGIPSTTQELRNIRAIQITVIARSGDNIPGYSIPYMDDNLGYWNLEAAASAVLPGVRVRDGFRRIRLISEVRSRNIGLL